MFQFCTIEMIVFTYTVYIYIYFLIKSHFVHVFINISSSLTSKCLAFTLNILLATPLYRPGVPKKFLTFFFLCLSYILRPFGGAFKIDLNHVLTLLKLVDKHKNKFFYWRSNIFSHPNGNFLATYLTKVKIVVNCHQIRHGFILSCLATTAAASCLGLLLLHLRFLITAVTLGRCSVRARHPLLLLRNSTEAGVCVRAQRFSRNRGASYPLYSATDSRFLSVCVRRRPILRVRSAPWIFILFF